MRPGLDLVQRELERRGIVVGAARDRGVPRHEIRFARYVGESRQEIIDPSAVFEISTSP